MQKIIDTYQDDLLMIYNKDQLKDQSYNYLAIIKNDVKKQIIDNTITCNYDEDFESLLNIQVPDKTRKPAKLLSYTKTLEVLERQCYATIGCIIDKLPYTYSMNYVMLDGHMYFHTGKNGYKLKALDSIASVMVVEDLGMAYNGTHNFRSIQILGRLQENKDKALNTAILQKYIDKLNPNHAPLNDVMLDRTLVYEITFDYMMGRENLYLPKDI